LYSEKLTLGSAQFGSNYGIANSSGKVKSSEVNKILAYAYGKGISCIDTASGYGISEKVIGDYFNENLNQKWTIITKLSGPPNLFMEQLETSIRKLGRKPDVVLAHTISDLFIPSFSDMISWLKNEMGISKIGVSIYRKNEIEKIFNFKYKIDVIQCPLNILDTRLYRTGLIDRIKENDIELHIRSVFLQGLFFLSEKQLNNNFIEVLPYIKKLKKISRDFGLSLSELSLLWVCSLNQVDKVIIGVDNIDQLKTHCKTINKEIDFEITEKITSIKYNNEKILNPSLWGERV
tara:strand:+ start:21827 stop:22699 length:873 start_codon:yes stop_codon:yes gene_type:complete